jgi:hypothetical protein
LNNTYKTVWNPILNALPQDQRGYFKLSQIASPERQKLGTNSFRPLNVVGNTHSPLTGHPWITANIANIKFSGQEIPVGNINGINKNFSLAHGKIDPSTISITINDIPLTINSDYSLSGATNQSLSFSSAPLINSKIYAYYIYGT